MPIVSISEAARLTKRNRKTIYHYLSTGQLSRSNDGKGVDTSELIRVFGEISKEKSNTGQPEKQHDKKEKQQQVTLYTGQNIEVLLAKIDHLNAMIETNNEAHKREIELCENDIKYKEEEIKYHKERVASLDRKLENTMMLLSYDRGQPTGLVETIRPWWKFWR